MELDLRNLEPRHAHDLLTSSIIPRPIAWVTTLSGEGALNLAPFSFFTGVAWNPPAIAFSVVNRDDGSRKNTIVNIEETGEFVVHIVSANLLVPMESSAKPIPAGEDLAYVKGIHMVPSTAVKPPRIAEARIAMECSLDRIVTIGEGAGAGNLIIGRVLLYHAEQGLIPNGREVDCSRLDALGRLSGNRYCLTQSVIESETN
ncbi:MAG: flavin reductase family protein [Eubacteriales bacterium]|nr:flavin reductase family protein [Eubacteriales bacterium]